MGKALGGLAMGLGIGFVALLALWIAYTAGRSAPPAAGPEIVEAPALPVAEAPPPVVAPPPPETPLQLATREAVQASLEFRTMTDDERAAALAAWGPLGEPAFATLERGTEAHIGRRSCYRGTVEEIHDAASGAELRVSLRSYSRDVIYVVAGNRPADDVVARTRVLVCGVHVGSFTYESQAGWTITLPLLAAVWVERRR